MARPENRGLIFASGPNDPRLHDVGEEFAAVLADLAMIPKVSRVRRNRFFHGLGTGVAGTLRVSDAPGLPAHDFFVAGREFPVIGRYSNGTSSDDACPNVRGISLKLLEDPTDTSSALMDLTLSTGECFAWNTAAVFHTYFGSDEGREELAARYPHFQPTVWSTYRHATSFATSHYFSQAPRCFRDAEGTTHLVRYRVLPPGEPADSGAYDPGDLRFPPDPPDTVPRTPGDTRSSTLLRDDLRARLAGEGITALLQAQLHPLTGNAAVDDLALDCSLPWSWEDCPWLTVGTLTLNRPVEHEVIEGMPFDIANSPDGLGIALARSPHENASLNHLRTIMYRLGTYARTGRQFPPELAALLRPRSSGAPRPIRPQATPAPVPAPRPVAVPRQNAPRRSTVNDGKARTVCVIGAGPSGLAFAHEIEKRGHRAIVLEAAADVAGKCESVTVDGHAYDLGGHICTVQYTQLAQLARELGVETEDATPNLVHDMDLFRSAPQETSFFRRETFQRYAALRATEFPRIAEAGLAHSERALAEPLPAWLAKHDLLSLWQSLGEGATGAGYGYLADNLPALYFVKYAEMTGLLSMTPQLMGHAGSFTIRGGFDRLWKRVADALGDVRCDVRVLSIERGDTGVVVHTDGGPVHADELALAIPPDKALPLLDANDAERDIADRVRHLDYWTTVLTATGLPRSAFYLLRQHVSDARSRGHGVAFHNRYEDSDVYCFYSYADPDTADDEIIDALQVDIERMGGQLVAVHTQRKWDFLPHFGSEDLADGVLGRLAAAQGENRTYQLGGIAAFELVESVVAHAQELADEFFPALTDEARVEIAVPAPRSEGATTTPGIDDLRAWLITRIADEARVPEELVDPAASLDNYALDSLSLAALQTELSDLLGYRVAPSLFFEMPTIDAISAHLTGNAGERSTGAPATKQPTLLLRFTPPRSFFCVGGAVGAAYYLNPLAQAIGPAHPFYAVQAPGIDGAEEPLDAVVDIAERVLEDLRLVQPRGPYLLGGHSFGGYVAYEIGALLREAGETVSGIVMIDTYLPLPGQLPPPPDELAAMEELLTMNRAAFGPADPVQSLDDSQRWQHLAESLGANGVLPAEEHLAQLIRVYQANLEATVDYRPSASDLSVTLIKASEGFPPVLKGDRQIHMALDAQANGWEDVELGGLRVIAVPGDHFTALTPPHLSTLAAAVTRCLSETAAPSNAGM